jgi:predicted nucleic acid-binding protein
MAFTALFDACVLYPPSVRDLLLSLAGTDLFRARWTDQIHDEWTRSVLAKHPELADRLRRTRELMEIAVPDASIIDYEGLIESITLPDPNDRHVVAAAIRGRADVIVTFNLKHFPARVLTQYNMEAQHPDTFVAHVLTLSPARALSAVREMRARLRNPSYEPETFIALFARQGLPETVTILRENIGLI